MSKNNITLIGINFYPEDSSTGLYSTQMAEYLSQTYDVQVITGVPYYPEWEIREDYKNNDMFLVEGKENITIYRYKQYVPKKPTFMKRILHLLDFTVGSFFNILKIKKCDLVICVVPFTSSIILGLLLAKWRGAKVWVHIQDFEFDAAVESGLAGEQKWVKSKIFKALFGLEKMLLDKADVVSTISYGMLTKLETKTRTANYFFPNWVDEDFINPAKAGQHELMQSKKFKILYSGNIGAKQDWKFFLRIVEHYRYNENIEFIIVGAGASKEWLIEQTQGIENVKHFMPVEYSKLPDLLCSADLHILFQKNDVVDTVMPSKLLGMMASAKPSVVTGNLNSEVAKVFSKCSGGYFFDSAGFSNVIDAIQGLADDKTVCLKMGLDARTYVVEHFSTHKVLNHFVRQVKKTILHSKEINE